ncbi:MAG: monovalent cation/H+ antiporter complex subunit F [Bacillota bacterium]
MINLTIGFLIIALSITFKRYLTSKSIWEKLLSLNLISIKVLLIITLYSVEVGSNHLLDTSVTFAIVTFLVIVLLSKFILKGGRTK